MVANLKIQFFFVVIVIIAVVASCRNPQFKPDNYIDWVTNPSNGLLKAKTINEMEFKAQYKPAEYIVLIENSYEPISRERFNQELSEFEGYHYFTFTITANGWNQELLRYKLQSTDEYFSRIQYYSFTMQEDFQLLNSVDTLPCTIFHYERTYGISPELKVVLGFNSQPQTNVDDLTLVYYDRVFNSGFIRLSFSSDAFSKLPKLVIS